MVVDATSLKILSAVLRIFDVLEENVTRWYLDLSRICFLFLMGFCSSAGPRQRVAVLENLARNRQAYQNLEAIYFLAPTDESVDLFIKDFSGRHLYAGGHLFFAGGGLSGG